MEKSVFIEVIKSKKAVKFVNNKGYVWKFPMIPTPIAITAAVASTIFDFFNRTAEKNDEFKMKLTININP